MIGATLLLALSAQSSAEANVVVATGSAERWVAADAAIVTLTVTGQAERPLAAIEEVRSSAERVLSTLRKDLPDPKAYRIVEPTVSPEYGGNVFGGGQSAASPRPPSYRAGETIDVRVDDLGRLGAFVKAATLTDAGVSVRFSVRDAPALRRGVLKEAFEDARTKAEESAQAAGLRMGDVVLIEVGSGATITDSPYAGRMVMGQALEIAKTNVLVHANLTVRFRLLK